MARMSTENATIEKNADPEGPNGSADLGRDVFSVNKSIVLVGLMGTGKTTIGRRLAEQLGLPFMDSDQAVEEAAALSISEIFEKMGEEAFRAGEKRVIERLLTGAPKVLATGGGAFITDATRDLIKREAVSVWLDAKVDVLVERTSRRDTRPLLKDGDPKEILEELSAKRSPFYKEADIHIQSSTGSHDIVVRRVIKALQECPKLQN